MRLKNATGIAVTPPAPFVPQSHSCPGDQLSGQPTPPPEDTALPGTKGWMKPSLTHFSLPLKVSDIEDRRILCS